MHPHTALNRELFFQQLREDLSEGKLRVTEETGIQLSAYAAHAIYGNYVEEEHDDHQYLALSRFLEYQDATVNVLIAERHKRCRCE